MSVLVWEKPKRKVSVDEWKKDSFDGGPPGGFRPNMSDEDMRAWKAKLVGKTTETPRVEIRKSTPRAQLLIVVSKDDVTFSSNAKATLTRTEYRHMLDGIAEAWTALDAKLLKE